MAQFEKFYIEISDFCALSCDFCPSAKRQETRGEMDLALFESLCMQIQNKAKRVCLHILGDPLSVKNFTSYVKIAHSYHLKIDLVTTGLFLKEQDFELLLQEPFIQVSFSLSAFFANKKLYEGAYMEHLNKILAFCNLHREKNAHNFINLRLHQRDITQRSKTFNAMIEAIRVYFSLPHIYLEQWLNGDKIKQKLRLAPKILLSSSVNFEWEQKDNDLIKKDSKTTHNPNKPLCYGAIKQSGVLSNGEFVPCCIDYAGKASFGNVKKQSIAKIIESTRFQTFRESLKNGIAPCELCQKCGYRLIL